MDRLTKHHFHLVEGWYQARKAVWALNGCMTSESACTLRVGMVKVTSLLFNTESQRRYDMVTSPYGLNVLECNYCASIAFIIFGTFCFHFYLKFAQVQVLWMFSKCKVQTQIDLIQGCGFKAIYH